MAMKTCPVCGEKYSDTYRSCPFCEEEKNFRRGKGPKRKGGHRVRQGGPSLLSPMLVIAILLMAVLLVYLLFGKAIGEKLGWGQDPAGSEPSGAVSSQGSSGASSSGEEPVVDPEPAGLTYEAALALPDGLTLSKTDYSTNVGDPDVTLSVSGGSGSYTWLSENDAIATVSESGTVTAVANGTVNILVTDGNQKAVCIVRVKGGASSGGQTGQTGDTGTAPSGGEVKLNREDFTLAVGESFQLKSTGITTTPTWSSSNPGVATVNGSGVVTGVSAGMTTVTMSYDGSTLTCIVRVK